MPALLEVIALTPDDAVAARLGGADRVELTTDMAADGLTPDAATVAAVRAATDLPLRVMLRAADSFSAGTAQERERLQRQAQLLAAAGADAFVLGFLDASGAVDIDAVTALVAAFAPLPWTFHRALDAAADVTTSWREVLGLAGCDTVLTAGSSRGVGAGLDVLLERASAAVDGRVPGGSGPVLLLAGGGLAAAHLAPLARAGVRAVHVGSAVRAGGRWDAPVVPELVARWRAALDDAVRRAEGTGAEAAATRAPSVPPALAVSGVNSVAPGRSPSE